MFRAAVLYAPEGDAMRSLAERIAGGLDRKRFAVTVKAASAAAVSDLAAADLVLLGSEPKGRTALHPDYSELARALAGINLAGRVAGLFAAGGDAPLAALKKALKDTDIQLEPEGLLRADQADARRLSAWLAGLAAQLDKTTRAG